jgi:ubiquinone/menaquinone biosynthesis C-methylase UbiE
MLMWILVLTLVVAALLVVGWWWRHYTLACPAGASWLVENPYMQAVAGPARLFRRMGMLPGMRLLDVGAGPGRLSLPAAEWLGADGEVVALDIQQKMLDKLEAKAAARGITNVRTIHAAADSGELPAAYFDRALLVTVLGEIPDKAAALAAIRSALKPGGVLSITEVIPDPHYQSRARVRALCRAAGFEEQAAFGNALVFTLNFIRP